MIHRDTCTFRIHLVHRKYTSFIQAQKTRARSKMDTIDLTSLIEHLEDSTDELKEALEPLLHSALSHTTAKLPLLDKAKLYVLVTYSIESLLFCRF